MTVNSAENIFDEKAAEEGCEPNLPSKEIVIDNDESDANGYVNHPSPKDASFGVDSDVDASHLLSDEEEFAQTIDDIVEILNQ